jgi:hypothetical protein
MYYFAVLCKNFISFINYNKQYLQLLFGFGWALRRTNTAEVIWRLSSFNGERKPQVPLHALL